MSTPVATVPTTLDHILTYVPAASFLLALFTAAFGLVQLRLLVKSIRSQTYQHLYDTMISIDKFFIDNPDLKSLFYPADPAFAEERSAEGARLASSQAADKGIDHARLASVAEMFGDYFDNVYMQRELMPRGTFDPFLHYMQTIYQHSATLKTFLDERESWYPDDFLKKLKAR
jgi:hypothetical protein